MSELHESTVVKPEASFGFAGFTCLPDDITERIGLKPDDARIKGHRRVLRNGREFLVPLSTWSIASRSPSKDINEHLRELLVRLQGANLPFDPAWGEAAFAVLWKGNDLCTGRGPSYEPDVLAGIAALGAALHQDSHQVDAEPPDDTSDFHRAPKRFFVGDWGCGITPG